MTDDEMRGFDDGYAAAADALAPIFDDLLGVLGAYSGSTARWLDANPDDDHHDTVAAEFLRLHHRTRVICVERDRARFGWDAGRAAHLAWRHIEQAAETAEGVER